MAELLFEIMCEEIPARMQEKAGDNLGRMVSDALKKSGLAVSDQQIFTGPRRLVFVADVPLRSPDVSEERKGPRTSAPEQALAGFMRGAGLTDISQAEIRTDKKGEYYVAMLETKGGDAGELIAQALPEVMAKFPWPKSMKSGTTSFRWVRPLQSLLCLLDGKIVPFNVNGFETGDTTSGHRRMGTQMFHVKHFADFRQKLEGQGHVILAAQGRKDIILKDAKSACAKAGLELVEDEGLLSEVAGLVEWPVVILGDMEPSFLELPSEVIKLSMRTHQKYFAVRDPKTGKLAPHFIVVANQIAPDGGKEIAKGNSRVLSARLADAEFFQSEDAKTKLIDNYDKLDGVIFHKKLGSIRDKSERVAALARELAPKVGADPDKAEAAARLAKCDLVTNMVVEFTSLQGQIGRLMYECEHGLTPAPSDRFAPSSPTSGGAKAENSSTAIAGEVAGAQRKSEGAFTKTNHQDIAVAIEHHYKPQGPSDAVPTNPVAVAVALADKLDTLVGFWAVDEKPTGSKDPFALRRAALGVVRIILENDITLNFKNGKEYGRAIYLACYDIQNILNAGVLDTYGQEAVNDLVMAVGVENTRETLIEKMNADEYGRIFEKNLNDLPSFLKERLKGIFRDQGVKYDIIDAVFALGGDDLVDISKRTEALQAFLSTDDGTNLLAGYKRASNILKAEAKKAALPVVKTGKGNTPEEAALFAVIGEVRPLIESALDGGEYAQALVGLSKLRAPIDGFFDNIMVVSEDRLERENRLGLLMDVRALAGTIADFDMVEG